MLSKVSNTSLTFNMNHGQDENVVNGLNNNSSRFPYKCNSITMWTCCRSQAWTHSSLIIKHYRVQVGNHHRGYRSPYRRNALKKKLLLLEQINQWLGVLGIHIEWRLQVSRPQNTSHVCMTDLGWFQRKRNKLSQVHGGNLQLMHMSLDEVTSFIQTHTSWTEHEGIVHKVSNTS